MKRDGLKYLNRREKQALDEYLERLRSEFKDEVQHVILYGSKVRGDFDEESDIDLFVVLKELDIDKEDAITRLSIDVDLKYDVLLSDFLVVRERYLRMAQINEPLYQSLQAEGVELWTRTPGSLLRSDSRNAKTTSGGRGQPSQKEVIGKPSAGRTTRSLRRRPPRSSRNT